jgi:benzoate-CoA ligase family protein
VQSHQSFVNTTRCYAHGVLGLTRDDITLSVPKLHFGYATGSNLLFPFSVGASTVLFPQRCTAARMFQLIERHRPTVLINVPTMIGKLLDEPGAATRDLSSLRICTSAGEALPEELDRRWRATYGGEILDGLGTAEMWHVFLSNRPGEVHPGTLGRAVDGFEVEVRGDDEQPLPDGEVGWLWVRGDSRAQGYWQRREKTRSTFRGEWVVTGDMVRRNADGIFTYCGRGDDMVKVSGKWLSPKEVENCLLQHPAVREAAVIAVPDAAGLVKPWAFVLLQAEASGESATGELLRQHALECLEPYKAPREVRVLSEFPRTHLGKVDRGALRKLAGG